MTPIRLSSTNLLLGPPEGSHGIQDLPVTKDEDGVMHSFWQLSEEDIANILAGVPVRLSIMGRGHPPVVLTVTDQA